MSVDKIRGIARELHVLGEVAFQESAGTIALAIMEARFRFADGDIDDGMAALRKIERILAEFPRERQGTFLPTAYELEQALVAVGAAITEAGVQSAAHRAHSLTDKAVREQVWELTDGRCAYCDKHLRPFGTGSDSFVVEHVVPRSAGGPDNLANYVPACMACNSTKSDGHVVAFIRSRLERRPMLRVVNDIPSTEENDQ